MNITSDREILDIVSGISFPFKKFVRQVKVPRPLPMSPELEEFTTKEIQTLLQNGSIEEIQNFNDSGWVSNIFVVPKPDGKHRMILNLKDLNKMLPLKHFKMDQVHDLLRLVKEGGYAASCDIKMAFNMVNVKPNARKFLQFEWQGRKYRYKVMPNGINCGPRTFTRLTRPIVALARLHGIALIIYIDDVVIVAKSYEKCLSDIRFVKDLLESVGFIINEKKSVLKPVQLIHALGFAINTSNLTISVIQSKAEKLVKLISSCLNARSITVRKLAKVIGSCIANFVCVPEGKLHFRYLEKFKQHWLEQLKYKWDREIVLDGKCIEELRWWKQVFELNSPYCFRLRRISVELHTDASGYKYGFYFKELRSRNVPFRSGCRFTEDERDMNINNKELLAIFYAVKALEHKLRDRHLLIRCDNTTAISCIKKWGSHTSEFRDILTSAIMKFLISLNCQVSITYIKSEDNKFADEASRNTKNDMLEWSLDCDTFSKLNTLFRDINMDLFASPINNKCERFISMLPLPGAYAVDAFCEDWSNWVGYAFPPFCILHKCMRYIRDNEVSKVYFIVPWFPTAPWFSMMTELLIDFPILLPPSATRKIRLPWDANRQHPLSRRLRLMWVTLSGNVWRNREFMEKLPTSWLTSGARAHRRRTHTSYRPGTCLITNGSKIQVYSLQKKLLQH